MGLELVFNVASKKYTTNSSTALKNKLWHSYLCRDDDLNVFFEKEKIVQEMISPLFPIGCCCGVNDS